MSAITTIARRYCGPTNSGNGGYVAGLLAGYLRRNESIGEQTTIEVSLKKPIPLDIPLDVEWPERSRVTLRHGVIEIASARSAPDVAVWAPPVSIDVARDAATRASITADNHMLPDCFVCGSNRVEGDGLGLIAGLVPAPAADGHSGPEALFAVPWTPHARTMSPDGQVEPIYVWSALDCPTAHVLGQEFVLLARMTARIARRPRAGEACVVTAKVDWTEGRKIEALGSLHSASGELLAHASNLWIRVQQHQVLN